MDSYRIYVLKPTDDVVESLESAFTSDAAALACAEEARAGAYAAEVWAGDRLVGRLGGEFRVELAATSAG